MKCSSYNIIRNNYLNNEIQKTGEVLDCGQEGGGNPPGFDHDLYFLDSAHYNLIEGNEFAGTSDYYSVSGDNGIQYAGQNGIIRKNVFYSNNVGLGMTVYSDEALHNHNNRVYQNVFYDNECAGISSSESTVGNIFKNNILFWNKGRSGGNCSGVSPAQIIYRGSLGGYLFERNNIINQSAGEDVIQQFGGSGNTLSFFDSFDQFTDNLELDPGFVDADNHDFSLADGSEMIEAGTFLTTTTNTGNGSTTMTVEDAGYFYDGFGIEGETGDVIQLEGQAETSEIDSIDYASNTITLKDGLTWTAGRGISLAYNGNAPDLGAFESGETATICVDMPRLLNYISQWKQGSISMPDIISKLAAWKSGEGC